MGDNLVSDGATFRRGMFGSWVVAEEAGGSTGNPTLTRMCMAGVVCLVGVVSAVAVWWHVRKGKRLRRGTSSGMNGTPVAVRAPYPSWLPYLMLANIAAHTWHYADNILRPVAYLEPKWLYQANVASPMEKTFAFLFPMSAVGVWGFSNAVAPTTTQHLRRGWLALGAYAAMSMVAGAHYAVDLPTAYGVEVNGSIMSETLLAAALGWVAWRFVKQLDDSSAGERAHDEAEVMQLVQEEEGSSSCSETVSDGQGAGARPGPGPGLGAKQGHALDVLAASRGGRGRRDHGASTPSAARGNLRSRSRERPRVSRTSN